MIHPLRALTPRPLGVRLQLMLWYTGVFAVLLLVASFLFYKYLQWSLAGGLDATLQVRAQQIAGEISDDDGRIFLHDGAKEFPGFANDVSDRSVPRSSVNSDIYVRLLNVQGKPLHETPAFRVLPVISASVTQPLRGHPWEGTVRTPDGTEVRLYSSALYGEHGRPFAILQVGQSLNELHDTLQHIAKELLALGIIVLLFSAIGSYWLASRAFAPIHQLTRTARSIQSGDLRQRVPVPPAHDEVHFLAVTFNEMLEQLQRLFTRQRRFVADASHELRTPVTVIRSKTDLALLEEMAPAQYQAVLREVNVEAERLGRLISDLLALARGDEGQTPFERAPLRLDLLAEAVAANAELLAAERGVTLHVQTPQPVTVYGDEARLIQAIMNLLDNAIYYTPAGGHVTLRVETKEQRALLTVADTGIGIAPEHLPHIFERFYRVDPARGTTERASSGLGLSIVEWIVRAHGGSIAVESQLGQGTTFTLSLPLAAAPVQASQQEVMQVAR
ncbi:MAG: HAMP domain-containing protein [Ktedonobacteraceae bacterium]|nr:HAMP domain-containing protein [Ktedonobacteraceae bacterium]